MKALIVEDDPVVARVIEAALREEAWLADVAPTGQDAVKKALFEQNSYDLIVLDVMLPDLSGIEVIRRIRAASSMIPVLFLTALDSVLDRVKGLDAGADDYLTKPFEVAELLARVRALSRRKGSIVVENGLEYGRLSVNRLEREGFANHTPLHLTVKEYELFEYLLQNAEQILTREQIFLHVWGYDAEAGPTVVEVYVHFLRKKLAASGCENYIRTIRGVGYMVKE